MQAKGGRVERVQQHAFVVEIGAGSVRNAGVGIVDRRQIGAMRDTGGEQAFAVSTTTGAFGAGTGQGADLKALSACQQTEGATDCAVVVKD